MDLAKENLEATNGVQKRIEININKKIQSTDIFEACINGRIEDVRYFIKDLNKRDENENTPLIIGK